MVYNGTDKNSIIKRKRKTNKKNCGCFYEGKEEKKKENNMRVGSSHFNLISIIE